MAGEELNEEGGDLEEGVEEGASSNATPVFSDQPLEGRIPLSVPAPIPAHNNSRDAIVN